MRGTEPALAEPTSVEALRANRGMNWPRRGLPTSGPTSFAFGLDTARESRCLTCGSRVLSSTTGIRCLGRL
jgi:hypothetical protein